MPRLSILVQIMQLSDVGLSWLIARMYYLHLAHEYSNSSAFHTALVLHAAHTFVVPRQKAYPYSTSTFDLKLTLMLSSLRPVVSSCEV